MKDSLRHHAVTQRLLLIAGAAAIVVLAFSASFGSMWDLWQTSDHRHGLLVFPIAAFLVWRVRNDLAGIPISVDIRGLLLLVPLAAGWIVARLAGIQVAEHFLVLAMIPSAVATLAGVRMTHAALFPLCFLVLAMPVGDSLVPHLMSITADLASALLKISGIPFLRDGQYISMRGGEFVIADVCSGVRYLLTGVMISLLFGYLTYSTIRKRVVLIVVTSLTLVAANGLRAYIVMAVASATDMQYFGGRDHIYFGWLMFGIVMMLIMWIGARYADDEQSMDAGSGDSGGERASHSAVPLIVALGLVMLGVTVKPLQKDLGEIGTIMAILLALVVFILILVRRRPGVPGNARPGISDRTIHFHWKPAMVVVATFALLLGTPNYAESIQRGAIRSVHSIDLSTLSCDEAGPWLEHWQPDFGEPDFSVSGTLDCEGEAVAVYVAAFASAAQGKELVSSAHSVVPETWDRVADVSKRESEGGSPVVEIKVNAESYPAFVWYWYEIDGRVASSPLAAKVQQILALIQRRPAGGRAVILATSSDGDADRTRHRLSVVASELVGHGDHLASGSND